MAVKEVLAVLFLVVLVMISGCGDKEECWPPMVMLGDTCCMDADNNLECDAEAVGAAEENITVNITAPVCGDGICDNETESCTDCWKDCGACKKIVYIYVPRNFTLAELQNDLNILTRDGIKFKKDIDALNNVSNFFYFSKTVPRYYADFMGIRYKFLDNSRMIVLNHIFLEPYYVNSSELLFNYVNISNWYFMYDIRTREATRYDNRIITNSALKDYPTQPTGYQKQFRYEDWEFRNYTREENVMFDNTTILDNGMVESLFASITNYSVNYKYHEYFEKDSGITLEGIREVDEVRLGYTHALSFICARNLVITLYNYDYDATYCRINEECLLKQIDMNRAALIMQAKRMKDVCDKKYSNKVMIYN
ncbi:hypothetical protein KY359_02675 [Candidatus Woesearchaeota archaeon]|nr:hypothetical protein [Candidatus Woesearchaeota archaeon]